MPVASAPGALREHGTRIAIDDFGTSSSSLQYRCHRGGDPAGSNPEPDHRVKGIEAIDPRTTFSRTVGR
jgi:hypothetical protein